MGNGNAYGVKNAHTLVEDVCAFSMLNACDVPVAGVMYGRYLRIRPGACDLHSDTSSNLVVIQAPAHRASHDSIKGTPVETVWTWPPRAVSRTPCVSAILAPKQSLLALLTAGHLDHHFLSLIRD